MEYHTEIDKLPPILTEGYQEMDPLAWNLLFMKFVKDSLPDGLYEQDLLPTVLKSDVTAQEITATSVIASITASKIVLERYPILLLEPKLENLIEDTAPDLNVRLPYPALFISKKFKVKKGVLMGIYAIEMPAVTYQLLLRNGMSKKEAAAFVKNFNKFTHIDDTKPHMHFMTVYVDSKNVTVIQAGIQQVIEKALGDNKEIAEVSQRAMLYAANVINLINAKVDVENPQKKGSEVRILPYYPGGKPHRIIDQKRNPTRLSIIRLFGDMKRYAEDYDREKTKATHASPKGTFLVRGHWRHFTHERYKNVRGKTIWIMPYVKGMNMDLHSKLIKVTG